MMMPISLVLYNDNDDDSGVDDVDDTASVDADADDGSDVNTDDEYSVCGPHRTHNCKVVNLGK